MTWKFSICCLWPPALVQWVLLQGWGALSSLPPGHIAAYEAEDEILQPQATHFLNLHQHGPVHSALMLTQFCVSVRPAWSVGQEQPPCISQPLHSFFCLCSNCPHLRACMNKGPHSLSRAVFCLSNKLLHSHIILRISQVSPDRGCGTVVQR